MIAYPFEQQSSPCKIRNSPFAFHQEQDGQISTPRKSGSKKTTPNIFGSPVEGINFSKIDSVLSQVDAATPSTPNTEKKRKQARIEFLKELKEKYKQASDKINNSTIYERSEQDEDDDEEEDYFSLPRGSSQTNHPEENTPEYGNHQFHESTPISPSPRSPLSENGLQTVLFPSSSSSTPNSLSSSSSSPSLSPATIASSSPPPFASANNAQSNSFLPLGFEETERYQNRDSRPLQSSSHHRRCHRKSKKAYKHAGQSGFFSTTCQALVQIIGWLGSFMLRSSAMKKSGAAAAAATATTTTSSSKYSFLSIFAAATAFFFFKRKSILRKIF